MRILLLLICILALPMAQPIQAQSLVGLPMPAAIWCGPGLPGTTHFTLAATGDTFPHENIQAVGEASGYDTLFDHIRPFVQASDLAYTNFDGAMLASSPMSGYPQFNYSPALASALRNAGIGLVSTANNHILDRGPEGLDATLAVLAEAGIQQHGTHASTASQQRLPPYLPITLTRDGVTLRIGFISATWGTNGIPDPYGQVNLLWASDDYGSQGGVRQSVLAAIAQARRETDLVVVAAHWGYEYQFEPDQSQIDGAHAMAAAGADLILGAQPHTLQPVDVIQTGERRTLVAYSLGNFLASQGAYQNPYFTATSVVLYVGIAHEPDGSSYITGLRYLPTLMIDGDTRPAALPADQPDLRQHVRSMLRDPAGINELAASPPPGRIEVCPSLASAGVALGGDFAWQYATLAGTQPSAIQQALALYGPPRGPPALAERGDCSGQTYVLDTVNQRLEWHPEADWPYRVVGSQVGAWAYAERYPDEPLERRAPEDVSPPFREFVAGNGGLPVFGLPIGQERQEDDHLVQYYERARLVAQPGGAITLTPLGQHDAIRIPCEHGVASANLAIPSAVPMTPSMIAISTPATPHTTGSIPMPTGLPSAEASTTIQHTPALPAAPQPDHALLLAAMLATLALTLYACQRAWHGFRKQR